MKKPFLILVALFVGLLFFAAERAAAFETADAVRPAQTIAPYLDDGVFAVARLDLQKVNPRQLLASMTRLFPADLQDVVQPLRQVVTGLEQRYLKPLLAQKVREIYVVLSFNDLPRGAPFLIVPLRPGSDPRQVAGILFSGNPNGPTSRAEDGRPVPGPFEECTQLGNAIFCGQSRTLERLKANTPSPRKHLAAAFRSVKGSVVQFLLVPSADQHRVLAELMPKLPEIFGGFSGRELSQAVQWVAVGIDFTPSLRAKLLVQSAEEQLARRLSKVLLSLRQSVLRQSTTKKTSRQSSSQEMLLQTVLQLLATLQPQVQGSRLTLAFDAESPSVRNIWIPFFAAMKKARAEVQRAHSMNNLKMLGLALHNFHDSYGSFPPTASYDKKGRRLLSWRVYLLPFLEQQALFKQFHLNEPWDSPHNKKLIAKMPAVFADVSGRVKQPGYTRYLAPLGPNYIFTGQPTGIRLRDVTDGLSNTILAVEVAPENAVIWTKPDDLVINAKNPLQGLLGKGAKGFLALFGDGSVRFVSRTVDVKVLQALFTRNGGENVQSP